jgi:hypothetical protein
MKRGLAFTGLSSLGLLALCVAMAPRAAAQDPILTPVIAGTAAPIVVQAITPKPKPGTEKFEGYVINANSVQVTVRSRNDERAIQTFALNEGASARMQKVIDKGGYQYGDKVTVYYDTKTLKAFKFKGKPSRPL